MTHVATTALPEIGAPYGGGFFAGIYLENGVLHALIVAPKAEGEAEDLEWGPSGNTAACSLIDGLANSNAINDDDHPAAQFCRDLRIGGYDDWHLPALDQMSVLRANLMPGAEFVPEQTTAEAFKDGGAEAFERVGYWTSTELEAGYAWVQGFSYGSQGTIDKGWSRRVRAVRKSPL